MTNASDLNEILRAISNSNGETIRYRAVNWSTASLLGEKLGYIVRIGKNSTKGWTITDAGRTAAAGFVAPKEVAV